MAQPEWKNLPGELLNLQITSRRLIWGRWAAEVRQCYDSTRILCLRPLCPRSRRSLILRLSSPISRKKRHDEKFDLSRSRRVNSICLNRFHEKICRNPGDFTKVLPREASDSARIVCEVFSRKSQARRAAEVLRSVEIVLTEYLWRFQGCQAQFHIKTPRRVNLICLNRFHEIFHCPERPSKSSILSRIERFHENLWKRLPRKALKRGRRILSRIEAEKSACD